MTIHDEHILELKNLHFIYATNWGLRGLNAGFPKNTISALLGPNGAGKSTLIKVLAGIYGNYSGSVYFKGKELNQYSRKELASYIGYVPQEVDIHYSYTVGDLLKMGRYPYQGVWDKMSLKDKEIIKKCMDITEINEFEHRPFSELSGGEKKRVLIASALVQEPEVLLLDEPTNGLDLRHQQELHKVLTDIFNRQLAGIILITHDLNFAASVCNHIVFMVNGSIVSQGDSTLLKNKYLMKHVFGVDFSIIKNPETGDPVFLTRY